MRDRSIIVTGGAGGLGTAVTGELLERGAQVIVPSYRARGEGELARFPHADAVTLWPETDLSDAEDVARAFEGTDEVWGIACIAGGFAMGSFVDTEPADLQRMIAMNLQTAFYTAQAAAKRMTTGGRIVFIGARPAIDGGPGKAAYAASKAAVHSLAQSLAEELRPREILVNTVVPTIIDTAANRAAMPDADTSTWTRPEDIAQVVAWLLDPANTAATGSVVPV